MRKGIGSYAIGDSFDGFMLIKEAKKGTASNGKAFLTLFFVDATGEIDAKLWDASGEDVNMYTDGKVAKLSGDINEFRGKAQMRIKSIRPAKVTDGVRVSDFLEKAPIEKETLQEQMMEAVFEMKNPNMMRIVRAFIKKYQEDLFVYPAASKNHHAFVSGLAYHVVSMLKIAKNLCAIYPSLNKDLLYAGIILHDIGKIHELSGVVSTTYTIQGNLLGHISIMVSELNEVAKELHIEGEEVMLLQHIVLSHHGKPEWGSAKQPQLKEAEILHLIDQIDAKMNMLDRALAKTSPGEFTERLFTFDHRSFYKPTFD
jgi:3'-5' exoribonuclease